MDTVNQLPIQLHTASHTNEHTLDAQGLEKFTPATKLGFHNKGLLSATQVETPHHVMVYNLHINYHQPGHFMWIPTLSWDEAESFTKKAIEKNKAVTIKLTPNYHLNQSGAVVNNMHHVIKAPIIRESVQGPALFFLNRQVRSEDNLIENVALINAMRDSLARNHFKIYIPQAERRAIFIKNTAGFHARTLFEEPIEGVDLTRVYSRAVDVNSEL